MRETWAEIDKGAYFHMRAGLQEESSFGVGGRSRLLGKGKRKRVRKREGRRDGAEEEARAGKREKAGLQKGKGRGTEERERQEAKWRSFSPHILMIFYFPKF